jgi:hypothetical protein
MRLYYPSRYGSLLMLVSSCEAHCVCVLTPGDWHTVAAFRSPDSARGVTLGNDALVSTTPGHITLTKAVLKALQ